MSFVTPYDYAKKIIRDVRRQGCCYELYPVLNGDKITVHYVVDGDRIGNYESSKNFAVGLPQQFLQETITRMKGLLKTDKENSYFATPYDWKSKLKKHKKISFAWYSGRIT